MHGSRLHEPYIPIDATTGIPSGIGLFRIVHTHGQYVLLSPFQMWGEVVAESDIAVRTMPQQDPIEIHIRIHMDTIKYNPDFLVHIGLFRDKSLSVPSDTSGKCTAPRSGRIIFTEITLYGPIMGEIQHPPLLVHKVCIGSFWSVSQSETPAFGKINSFTRNIGRCATCHKKHAADSRHKQH